MDTHTWCTEKWGFDPLIGTNIVEKLGITELFKFQVEGIDKFTSGGENDLWISAPTGSGKTLVFVVPVVGALVRRVVCRTRCLVLLPTRELASQCKQVFDAVCSGSQLKVVCSVGQTVFEKECHAVAHCDILIATPGRLMDHMKYNKEFTLQHLAFLVVDEADRLLGTGFHGWLEKVLNDIDDDDGGSVKWNANQDCIKITPVPTRKSVRKILCSATLTDDPQKVAALKLCRPIHVDYHLEKERRELFNLPKTLTNHIMLCDRMSKPLALIQLLNALNIHEDPVLIFAASVEAAHRLAVLLQNYFQDSSPTNTVVGELTSALTTANRNQMIRRFKQKKNLHVLVASDVMARGIDIDNLAHVINYDVPNDIKGFVHRVGRVARAGRSGAAYTILHPDQLRHFHKYLVRKLGLSKENIAKIQFNKEQAQQDKFETALMTMKQQIEKEQIDFRSRKRRRKT